LNIRVPKKIIHICACNTGKEFTKIGPESIGSRHGSCEYKRTTTQVSETPHSYRKPCGNGLWILSLIKCSTSNNLSNFLSNVGHITHTCTQQSPPQVWVHQFIVLIPQAEALSSAYTYTCTAVDAKQNPPLKHYLSRRLSTQRVGRILRQTSILIPLLGHEVSHRDHLHPCRATTQVRETTHSYPKL